MRRKRSLNKTPKALFTRLKLDAFGYIKIKDFPYTVG